MRTIRTATEAEVLDCFWTAELSPHSRWSKAEVESRKDAWREREGLFLGLPDDVEWERVVLTRHEVLSILYINWDWWLKVTNGTRLPTVAAEVQGRDEGDRAIAAAAATNPELIVVTDSERSKLVLLEGHVRLTAYGAFPRLLPDELEIYLGVSTRIADWCQW
ncbi:MAG TPA: hypothetical protein VGI69_04690 [Gaiellaceae bacterium]|jgi:hypothetical protein